MRILNQNQKMLWIKAAHIFVAMFFVFGIFSFYISNVYSYPGEDNLGDVTCTDGIDNDSDGYIDYSDSQCTNPPGTPDLLVGSDTGSSNTDNITNLSYSDISVACDSNYIVKLYMGGVQIGSDAVCSANSAGFSLFSIGTSLGEGSSTFTATQVNHGETVHSGILTVTLDTFVPDAPGEPDMTTDTDSGYASSDNITSDTTPDFFMACEAYATVSLIDGVDDTTVLGSGACFSSGYVTITSSTISGSKTIRAIQTDVAGNVSSLSTSLSVTIDTTAPSDPTVAPDLYFSSDLGTSSADDLTNDTTPSFIGSCNTYSVTLFNDGAPVGTAVCSDVNYIVTSSVLLSEGSHDMAIVAIDAAGNQSASSPTLTITIDATAPTISSNPNITPDTDSGISSDDDITSNTTPTFTGACTNGSIVQLYDDGVSSGSSAVCSSLAFSLTTGTLAEGSNSITFTETDAAGNVSSESSVLSVTIDTTAPTTSGVPNMTSGTDSGSSTADDITSDTTPTFTGACTNGNTVQLFDDGSASGSSATCSSSVFSLTSGTLATGSNVITFKETDVAGNISNSSTSLTITIDTTAPTTSGAPDMTSGTDSGSSTADDITSDTTPTFTGVCTDGNTVQLFDDGSSSGSSATCASSIFSLTTGTLAEGSNSITFTETDAAGNISSASTALVVTIDSTSPTLSEVTPISTGTDTTPSYTFTTNEAGTITYGGSCSSLTTSATSGSNTITLVALAVGTYSDCTITVTDTSSNASSPLSLTSFTISAEVTEETRTVSGSASTQTKTLKSTKNTPYPSVCEGGATHNIYTGFPCKNSAPITPGCFQGFGLSILTGEACSKNVSPQTPALPNTPTTPPTPLFTKDLELGDIHPEVKLLQIFLNTNGFIVSTVGNGRPGFEINRFGPGTVSALIRFQKANGITPAVGFFGPRTRGVVNGVGR